MSERVVASYDIETAYPLEAAAAAMAGEQSTGTFTRVPGETDALRAAHGARVERIVETGERRTPALPGAGAPESAGGTPVIRRAEVELSWPISNMGPSLPNLLATVAGNLFELRQFSALRLLDLSLPPAFAEAYLGPQYGITGTRRLSGVAEGPLIGTIIKPSVGLTPEATAEAVRGLVAGGIDFIKDDELQGDGPGAACRRCCSWSRRHACCWLPSSRPARPGSPLCRGYAPESALDGLEIALKGGQVGGATYFRQVLDSTA
jgi:ribulose-bisphosphate carboxylase large chain